MIDKEPADDDGAAVVAAVSGHSGKHLFQIIVSVFSRCIFHSC